MLVQVGMNTMDCYEADFEAPMLVDTAQYYKRKAAVWIEEDSCPDYMVKAEENLKMEEERVRHRQMSCAWPLVGSGGWRQIGCCVACALALAGIVRGWQLSCACMGLDTAVQPVTGASASACTSCSSHQRI